MNTIFTPIKEAADGLNHVVSVWGRSYTFGANGMPNSLISNGKELLAAPMRLVGIEEGEEIAWDTNYPDNESESFVQSRSEEAVTICGAMQSTRFVADMVFTIERDGAVKAECKLMPRGKTVAQVFSLAGFKPVAYKLDRLWLEIPLKAEALHLFSMLPNGKFIFADGTESEMKETSTGGAVPAKDASMPFKALLWLGNDNCGFGWSAENDRNWQPADPSKAIELVHDGDILVLRIHLLDSHPRDWTEPPEKGMYAYKPVTFAFGFMATPVKQFPKYPYADNTLHIDCFVKIKGNYIDFLAQNNRYDRLVEKGVKTLILHEKWNKSQNWSELSEFTEHQIRTIVSECHKRGIRVLTYFGYEISSMATAWSEISDDVAQTDKGEKRGGWYRVPFQRDYVVCYNSSYQQKFLDGVERLMDSCHTDGVYLDGTSTPRYCDNMAHGCGWRDWDGTLRGSYPISAIRHMFQKLSDIVHSRGGIINVHGYACMNFMAAPYIDVFWFGENLQFQYIKGNYADMPLDYFRAEYTGRNVGVPVEFLAYENRPKWNFENGVAVASIHGILPRPNDIEHPLDVMAPIWKIVNQFPIAQSTWHPYWENAAKVSDARIKVSYYRYVDVGGNVSLLAFCANTTHDDVEATVTFPEDLPNCKILNASKESDIKAFDGYGFKILFLS